MNRPNRMTFGHYFLLGLAAAMLMVAFSMIVHGEECPVTPPSQPPVTATMPTRPNIVLILCDDCGTMHDARLDALAAQGVLFTQHDAETVCSPGRAALLTGRHPARSGITAVLQSSATKGLPVIEKTFADYARNEGYLTAHVGKWHLNDLDGFRPDQHGFTYVRSSSWSSDMIPQTWWEGASKVINITGPAGVLKTFRQTLNARERDAAIEFLRDRDPSVPYLLYLSFNDVHSYSGMAPLADRFDAMTGDVEAVLEEVNLANTVVIYTTDNGSPNGDPDLRGEKDTPYEGGLRGFTFVLGAGIQPGVVPAPTWIGDWFPTILEAAGAALPTDRAIDGRTLWPLILGTGPRADDEFLWTQAYRKGDYKVVDWGNIHAELFLLPDENTVVNDPTLRATMIAHAKVLKPKVGLW